MAGGLVKYRHLSRNSSARQALLRGLVTSLVAHEHIHTTYAKAKEAQRLADKLITYAKRDNEETRRKAQAILYTPHDLLPKLFGELRERYSERPGGYTRVLRTEPRSTYDQAPSAILELVDGPRDARFMMTAKAVAFDKDAGKRHTELTMKNVAKVTRYRKDGKSAFADMVASFRQLSARSNGGKGKKAEAKETEA
ncbi:ribosomal protein L17 [Colletotrichum eremochloae]|uniref:Large ribosomal subunit protein bL17m n=1 Tax=Colletotrichum sublineola TaxID=1173701 RepID=A0A066X3L5_COLSU|nr:ribosomal protein L17 [Colletotrichum sublineola]KAK2012656.1 ribosomal protein L17 [Colletotrichum eremochloae]KDN63698.1 putative ribosomal protein L17 [Colletotrichum sublineola]